MAGTGSGTLGNDDCPWLHIAPACAVPMNESYDCDYLIVGSGFGGSVSALRLAEKGWKVIVAEQGRRIGPEDMLAGKQSVAKLSWLPQLGWRGYFVQRLFRHVAVVGGVGVGGGSLVWAAVMLEAKPAFYEDPRLKNLGVDWRAELAPHYTEARRMLGVATNPHLTRQDELVRQTAERMGVGETFGAVPNAIYFGEPGVSASDPYFGGAGPARTGCRFCGGCLTGCPYGSKNSLTLNYLWLAERHGVPVLSEHEADRIEPLAEGGYRVSFRDPVSGRPLRTIRARQLVLAAGVVGTLKLLYRNRDQYRTLPRVSATLGQQVCTNSEAFTAVLHPKGEQSLLDGTAISSDFYPDARTHITQNRFDRGMRFMRAYFGPLTAGHSRGWRALKTVAAILTSPRLAWRNLFAKNWEQRLTVFTVMQDLDNRLRFMFRRTWWSPFKPRLLTATVPGHEAPSYLPVANRAAEVLAEVSGGQAMGFLTESLAGIASTAHILGGCGMGRDASEGVIDRSHEVHGHRGLYVVDGSSIPGNIGVNPSLTITAMAERFAAGQAAKPGRESPAGH